MTDVPLTLIGGTHPQSSEHTTSFCVDWISATFKEGSPPPKLPDPICELGDVPLTPRTGYARALELSPAGRVDWHPTRPSQGVGYEWRGNDMKHLRKAGVSDHIWPVTLTAEGCQVTRFDFAIDLKFPGPHPRQMRAALKADEAKTPARSVDYYEQDRGSQGATLYLGTRKSDRMLRIYDKAAESGENAPWTRIEIVLRSRYAMPALRQAVTWGLCQTMKAQMLSMLVAPTVTWYTEAIGDLVTGAAQPDRSEPDDDRYLKWLRESILPGIKDRILDDRVEGLRELIETWYDELKRWLD